MGRGSIGNLSRKSIFSASLRLESCLGRYKQLNEVGTINKSWQLKSLICSVNPIMELDDGATTPFPLSQRALFFSLLHDDSFDYPFSETQIVYGSPMQWLNGSRKCWTCVPPWNFRGARTRERRRGFRPNLGQFQIQLCRLCPA